MAKRLESPCVDICQLDPESGLCIGCKRTIDEIGRWSQFTPAERHRVLTELPGRKLRLKAG